MAKTTIVYFSESNNTKASAEYLAGKIGASLTRLVATTPANPMLGMLHVSAKLVGNPWDEIQETENLILMSPIYAFNGVPAVRGFLTQADLKGKKILIITNGAAPAGKISDRVKQQYQKLIEKANGTVDLVLHTVGGNMNKFAGEEHLHAQIDALLEQVQAWLGE